MTKVLVGEGNFAEFAVLSDYLTGKGYEVHWVKSGPDAVAAVDQIQPDLMILDALIPELTGLKVCQKVKKSPGGENIRTILLSKVYRQFKEQYESRQTLGVDAYSEKPVNVAELDTVINRLVGDLETPPSVNEVAGEAVAETKPEEGKRTLGTKGALSDTPFPRLLYYLCKYKRTGALRVAHEQISKIIYLHDGALVFVTSNLSNESLGRFMVQRGVITDEQYNTSLQRMLQTSKQQGNVLLEMDAVTPHQLFESLQGQIREKVLRVFAWDDGEYEFRPGAFKIDESVQFSIPPLKLILDGVKRFYTLTRLERYFNEYKNQRLRRLKKSLVAKGEMTLTPHEAKFFKLIDGKRTVGKIVAHSHLSLSETFQMLYFLLLTEVIRFVGDPGFATRGIKEQEAFLADRRRRQSELRDLKDDKSMVLDDRRRRFRLAVSRAYDLLGTHNFYEQLRIPADADSEHIRAAYHTLARELRPFDLYQDAEPQLKDMSDHVFKSLTESYETLLDAERRQAYNKRLWDTAEPAEPKVKPEPAMEAALQFDDQPAPDKTAGVVEGSATDDMEIGDVFSVEAVVAETAAEETPGFADFVNEADRVVNDDVDMPDIEWDVGEDLAAGAESDATQTLDDFGTDSAIDQRVAEAGEVTENMANLVKSELSFQTGEDALHNQDYETAKRYFIEAVELNSTEAEYHAYLGWVTFLAAPHDPAALQEGRDLIEQAISINPVLDSGYTFLGMLNLQEGNRNGARRNFEQALQYNPENSRARKELAKLESM